MAHIEVTDAQAWAEESKLSISELDPELEDAVATGIIARLAGSFNTAPWIDNTNTPKLVRKIIAMAYVAWFISRAYSSDEGRNDYSQRLLAMVNDLIEGLIAGSIILVDDDPINLLNGVAQFYPTDASSALEPTAEDRSLGGPVFTMGVIW